MHDCGGEESTGIQRKASLHREDDRDHGGERDTTNGAPHFSGAPRRSHLTDGKEYTMRPTAIDTSRHIDVFSPDALGNVRVDIIVAPPVPVSFSAWPSSVWLTSTSGTSTSSSLTISPTRSFGWATSVD